PDRDGLKQIIDFCNGFQALVNMGLLPGFDGDYRSRRVALTYNDCGNFRNDWVWLTINTASPCVFTQGMTSLELPVRHGEGKFYAKDPEVAALVESAQIVVQYALPDGSSAGNRFPFNPNGSLLDIAGICDPTGRVFGLMPHPEAYNHFTNHPQWTRLKELGKRRGVRPDSSMTPGVRLLFNGVEYVRRQLCHLHQRAGR
ncbi:phosphoribosylformylglycinamidine synthase subunit PurQ, partial [Thermodesulfobacteriota bacterium]